ncbi:MAG: sigma-70 family RNA polymerase sigma factor [Pirellulaceae bacterium]|nr:sigma-70 family RNA polymerase sigma factor [Pirellulaceae bacterium]
MHSSPQESEFVRLWLVYGQSIYAYLLTLMSNRADADEIYQDVGMTLWEKFGQFAPGSNFQAWARQVALNKVRDFRRLRRHQTVLCSPEFLDAVAQTIAEDTEILDRQHKVWSDCFERLPIRQKDLIDRRYRLGETPKSLSERTGRSLDAIYQALSRIHRALFDCVREGTFGESSP